MTGASRFNDVLDGVCSASAFFADGNLDVALEGGGLFNRGEVGHDGEVCPDLNDLSEVRAPSSTTSTLLGCSIGLWAERALCTAAADGTVDNDPLKIGFLVGLNSWLFFLERDN